MTIHREGYKSIAIGTLIFGAINFTVLYFFSASLPALCWVIFLGTLFLLLFLISFFRIPARQLTTGNCPCRWKSSGDRRNN
jgi:phosphatidylserine decarboxylase